MKRLDITFTSVNSGSGNSGPDKSGSGNDACAAWLYLPESSSPAPVIVMAHGLGGVRTMRLDAFAQRFCEAGYACLVFDYRHFGDSGGQPRQLLNINKQLQDWSSAVEFAKADERVNGEQVIVWGTSFGGGHVLKIGATIDGVAGVISQCPFTDGLASSLAHNPISSLKVTALALADLLTSPFKKQPIQVKLAGKASQAGLMTAHDVIPGYQALLPENAIIPDTVAARFALDIIRYYPGKSVKNIKVPTLLMASLKDTVAPVKKTLQYGKQLPKGEVHELDAGHFDIYVGDWFEKNIAIQLDWLKRNFPIV